MGKWIGIVLIFLTLVFFLGIGWFYFFFGLKYYIQAVYSISRLQGDDRAKAVDMFYGANQKNIHPGIIAGLGENSVWIYSRHTLKNFTVDANSIYSFFNGCNDNVLDRLKVDWGVPINRDVGADFAAWKKQVKVGDYVSVMVADEGNGGTPGNLREIWSYDWWLFMPIDMKTQCAK